VSKKNLEKKASRQDESLRPARGEKKESTGGRWKPMVQEALHKGQIGRGTEKKPEEQKRRIKLCLGGEVPKKVNHRREDDIKGGGGVKAAQGAKKGSQQGKVEGGTWRHNGAGKGTTKIFWGDSQGQTKKRGVEVLNKWGEEATREGWP